MRMDQRGTTLLELLAATAITGLIVAGLGSGLFQFLQVSRWGGERLAVSHQAQKALHWVGRDIPMAQTTDLIEGSPASAATLRWTDRYGNGSVSHTLSFTLMGSELRRNYDGQLSTVAKDISSVEFTRTGKTVTVTVVATSGSSSRTGTVSFSLRPDG